MSTRLDVYAIATRTVSLGVLYSLDFSHHAPCPLRHDFPSLFRLTVWAALVVFGLCGRYANCASSVQSGSVPAPRRIQRQQDARQYMVSTVHSFLYYLLYRHKEREYAGPRTTLMPCGWSTWWSLRAAITLTRTIPFQPVLHPQSILNTKPPEQPDTIQRRNARRYCPHRSTGFNAHLPSIIDWPSKHRFDSRPRLVDADAWTALALTRSTTCHTYCQFPATHT
jgi:hypothetical protein